MTRNNKEEVREGIRYAGKLLPSLFPLVLKLGKVYLRFKKDAQKAGKIFEKELRANGIDKETAKAMTEIYLNSSRILSAFDYSEMVRNGFTKRSDM
jgi:hypothetical protein